MRAVTALWALGAVMAWTVAAYLLIQGSQDPGTIPFVLILAGAAAASAATVAAREGRRPAPDPDPDEDGD